MTALAVSRAIAGGVACLLKGQERGRLGSSLFYEGERLEDLSPFGTGVVALSMLGIDVRGARQVVRRAVTWLDRRRPIGDVWRYWEDAGGPHRLRVLRDTDDTAMLSLLFYLAMGRRPACVPVLLAQQDGRGRFGTWIPDDTGDATGALYPHCSMNAPDLVVNLNVSLLLETLGIAQRGVTEWVMAAVAQRSSAEETLFYRVSAPYSVYQAIVRNREAGVRGLDMCDKVILQDLECRWSCCDAWGSALNAALAVDTLCTVGAGSKLLEAGVEALVGMQEEDGSWPASPLYGSPGRRNDGFGSAALTTGYAIRALFRARQLRGAATASPTSTACSR